MKFRPREIQAFSLVEVVLALGLVTFVLVAIVGLFSVAFMRTREAENHSDTANLASRMVEYRLSTRALNDALSALPPIEKETLPEQKPSYGDPVLLNAEGIKVGAVNEAAYELRYSYWKEFASAAKNGEPVARVSVVLTSPAGAGIANARETYELLTSALVSELP